MKNKSKYFIFGAIVLLAVVVIVVLMLSGAKSPSPAPENSNISDLPVPVKNNPTAPEETSPAPQPSSPIPAAGAAVPATNAAAPAESATATTVPSAPAANTAPANGLVGTWISSVTGKGMQGSGKVTLNGIVFQLNLAGGVNLVIQKVENNTGTGTITFNNVCVTGTKTVVGKPAAAFSPQC